MNQDNYKVHDEFKVCWNCKYIRFDYDPDEQVYFECKNPKTELQDVEPTGSCDLFKK